jgi:hypothetical protein
MQTRFAHLPHRPMENKARQGSFKSRKVQPDQQCQPNLPNSRPAGWHDEHTVTTFLHQVHPLGVRRRPKCSTIHSILGPLRWCKSNSVATLGTPMTRFIHDRQATRMLFLCRASRPHGRRSMIIAGCATMRSEASHGSRAGSRRSGRRTPSNRRQPRKKNHTALQSDWEFRRSARPQAVSHQSIP